MDLLKLIGNLLGIGKTALNNRAKLKQAKVESVIKIEQAKTNATVNRINSNSISDNQMDAISKEQQSNSFKDELVSIIFLTPMIVATLVPLLVCYKTGDWLSLMDEYVKAYKSLGELPVWVTGGIALVVIDILGFRSFLRKAFTLWLDKTMAKSGLLDKIIKK